MLTTGSVTVVVTSCGPSGGCNVVMVGEGEVCDAGNHHVDATCSVAWVPSLAVSAALAASLL